jgi:hypothetical protein
MPLKRSSLFCSAKKKPYNIDINVVKLLSSGPLLGQISQTVRLGFFLFFAGVSRLSKRPEVSLLNI